MLRGSSLFHCFLTPIGVQKCKDLQLCFTDLFGGSGSFIIQKALS